MSGVRIFCHWFWRERSGLLLFTAVHGVSRLAFEIPLLLLVVYALQRWFSEFPDEGRRFILSALENPFFAIALFLIFVHELGVRYLRDQLAPESDYFRRLMLLLPGRAMRLYSRQRGSDWAYRTLRKIRFAAIAVGGLGLLLLNWGRIGG